MALFTSNPFSLLEPENETKQKVDQHKVMYTVEKGKECARGDVVPAQFDMERGWCPTSTTFYGTCHNCKYRSHSQRKCPLRKCAKCGVFGHAASVCNLHQDL